MHYNDMSLNDYEEYERIAKEMDRLRALKHAQQQMEAIIELLKEDAKRGE